MRAATALVLAVLLATPREATAKPTPKPKPPSAPATKAVPKAQAAVTRFPDGWRADLSLDGPLQGWALLRRHDGVRAFHLLVGHRDDVPPTRETAPCAPRETSRKEPHGARLYRWLPGAPDRLELLGSGLPAGSLEAADLDGDGEDELLLVRDGEIDLVNVAAGGTVAAQPLVTDPSFRASCCGPRLAWDAASASDPVLRSVAPGAFRTYRRGSERGLALVSEQEIPQSVTAGAERVSIGSPPVWAVGRPASGRMVFATEPQALGKRRLRTMFLDPDGARESQSVESWALFPAAARVVDSRFALLDASPVLIVTTTSGDKLSLLGEKELWVFPLGGDRTRAGDAPVFTATTGINLWQQARPVVVDLDGDGHDELVLVYWKGLKNAIAALEVYRGGVSPILTKEGTTSFDVEGGEKDFIEFGSDLDGDGRPDMLVMAHRELLVFPGVAAPRAVRKPVESTPSRRIALPADLPDAPGDTFSMGTEGFQIARSAGGLGTARLLDLDGDGRPEVLFAGDGPGEAGRAVIVVIAGASPLAPSSNIQSDATRRR